MNGYSFLRTNAYNGWIVKGRELVVGANVVTYEVVEHYVIGIREKPIRSDVSEDLISKEFGYFILDTVNGTLEEGMTEEAFSSKVTRIKAEGVRPDLSKWSSGWSTGNSLLT